MVLVYYSREEYYHSCSSVESEDVCSVCIVATIFAGAAARKHMCGH